MIKASWKKYRLRFRFLARTSRSSMRVKDTYFVTIFDDENPQVKGVGECNLFSGLSADDTPDFEERLTHACNNPLEFLPYSSAIRFGFETAFANLNCGGGNIVFPSRFTSDSQSFITINGLIWMGSKRLMLKRVAEKIEAGFSTLKLKIGGIDFNEEIDIIRSIRRRFPVETLTLRLDANGAFSPKEAIARLNCLSEYEIHSIEQPIKAGQLDEMARLCIDSPIPIALDEELIGCRTYEEKRKLLSQIKPAYIILKPALCGGFKAADEYLGIADELGIGYWATSALESNVGLNAIAQWTAMHCLDLPQGLGTGGLYSNNTPPTTILRGDRLYWVEN